MNEPQIVFLTLFGMGVVLVLTVWAADYFVLRAKPTQKRAVWLTSETVNAMTDEVTHDIWGWDNNYASTLNVRISKSGTDVRFAFPGHYFELYQDVSFVLVRFDKGEVEEVPVEHKNGARLYLPNITDKLRTSDTFNIQVIKDVYTFDVRDFSKAWEKVAS